MSFIPESPNCARSLRPQSIRLFQRFSFPHVLYPALRHRFSRSPGSDHHPRRTFTCRSAVLAFILSGILSAEAASPLRVPVTFSRTEPVSLGTSVFVVGNHPDLGAWDVTRAVKLRWTPGNVWMGDVAIQAGTQLEYKFISRNTGSTVYCTASNSTDLTQIQTLQVPAQPDAPYKGKTIYYHSSWTQAFIQYRSGANWINVPMDRAGPGRTANEHLYKVSGIGEAGEGIEFVPNNGAGLWDNSTNPGYGLNNYYTTLDVFWLQDKHLFNYPPPATVSAPRIVTRTVTSSSPEIPSRTVRIYLPRGYTENTTRRYPVMYLHDGQNVFDPGGPFGSWSADATATREIREGRMRETILVGIDNSPNRIREYLPPVDSYQGGGGVGDKYAAYLINDVRPTIDANYRTLTGPANTFTAGSSMGGVISTYLGRDFEVFGKIGILSPAYWTCPNYMAQLGLRGKKEIVKYLDWGTTEGASMWEPGWNAYELYLQQGYAPNGDMLHVIGCGQGHNEAAWRARLPRAFQYLMNIWDEPNLLAQKEHPPKVSLEALAHTQGAAEIGFSSLRGFSYKIQRSTDLAKWDTLFETPREPLPWAQRTFRDEQLPAGPRAFWRLEVDLQQ
jgi:predicted alpha/beta superfamily hydrolase